jgi:2-haloalkanoic acid dehalogenase type II
MIRAIAFDLDNTLIDFNTFKRKTANAAAKAMIRHGLKGTVKGIAEEIWDIYGERGIEYQKTFGTLLWEKHGIRDLTRFERIQQAGILAYLDEKFKCLRPYADVPPTLRKLSKRFPLYIITDAPRNKAWQRLVITGLYKFFPDDHVITFDDTKVHKPDPMPFREFLKRTGFKPEEVLFVGDNPERDVKGAKSAGMKTALAAYGWVLSRDSKEKAGYVLKSFKDLQETVRVVKK